MEEMATKQLLGFQFHGLEADGTDFIISKSGKVMGGSIRETGVDFIGWEEEEEEEEEEEGCVTNQCVPQLPQYFHYHSPISLAA